MLCLGCFADLLPDRDPEAEAEEKIEEKEVAPEEEAAVVQPGFNAAAGGDWDAAPAGFAGATAAAGWDAAPAGEDWAAAPAPAAAAAPAAAGGDWATAGEAAAKPSQW